MLDSILGISCLETCQLKQVTKALHKQGMWGNFLDSIQDSCFFPENMLAPSKPIPTTLLT